MYVYATLLLKGIMDAENFTDLICDLQGYETLDYNNNIHNLELRGFHYTR